MKFSIIVPFYNEGEKMVPLIESLLRLDKASQAHEVILVDNKSTDDSINVARKYDLDVEPAPQYASSYYARNVGASCASGEYLLFIDADCIADKSLLKQYEQYIATASRPHRTVFAGGIHPAVNNGNLFELYAENRKILNQKSAITGWAYRPFAQTANALYSREMFLAVGGFHHQMSTGGDAEICWRFADQCKADFIYAESAFVRHRHRADADSLVAQFQKYGAGRVQQAALTQEFRNGQKDENFLGKFNAIAPLLHSLQEQGVRQDDLFQLLDFIRDSAYECGIVTEIIKTGKTGKNLSDVATLHQLLAKRAEDQPCTR